MQQHIVVIAMFALLMSLATVSKNEKLSGSDIFTAVLWMVFGLYFVFNL